MDELCKIRDIARMLYGFENEMITNFGICLNEGMVLCTISKNGTISSGAIREHLGLSSSNTSKVIASVERKGLVERHMGTDDRRSMYFALTPKGKECLAAVCSDTSAFSDLISMIKNS